MSKLSELLPAGASGKTIEAVATANIANKAPVILNSAGTVTQVAIVNTSNSPSIPTGVATTYTTETPEQNRLVFDPFDSTRFIVVWNTDNGNSFVKLRVGTITGTSIALNTATTVYGVSVSGRPASVAFDPNNENVFVVTYKDESSTGQAKVGTISGTRGSESVAYGSATQVTSVTPGGPSSKLNANVQFVHGSSEKFILYYTNTSSNYPYAVVFTYSGTTITSGTPTVLNSAAADQDYAVLAVNTETEGNFVSAYVKSDSYLYVKSGNISGTAITMDSNETKAYTPFANASIGGINWCNGTSDSFLLSTKGNLGYATFIAGKLSGTTFSFGTPVQSNSSNTTVMSTSTSVSASGVGGSYGGHEFIATHKQSDNYLRGQPINVVGTTVTHGTAVVMVSENTGYQGVTPFGGMSDSVKGTFAISYRLNSATSDGVIRLGDAGGDVSSANLTATNFVGVADAAISSGAAGTIVVQGGTATGANATLPPVLSFGSAAIFESDGINYPSSTFDSNSNKVVTAYMDDDNSDYGTAVVGTVSGTSVSWGTAVVFEAAATTYISATFDSASNKVVIAYCDVANSNYGTAIVGTVSGTAISFGTPVVFEAAAATFIAATFDSDSNKVVIVYRDAGNSEYGTAIVGTVSGTSISFGTAVVFHTYNSQNMSATFDSTANKVVISYTPANTDYGNAIVGTVSGTAISFGTAVIFESAGTQYISSAFDSNLNKVVISYRDSGNADKGTAVVGTVSGTAISFGTAVVYSTDTANNSTIFDSNSNKIVISYRHLGNSGYGTSIVGTVSGTAISFDTPVLFSPSSSIGPVSATFDSNANKMVVSYQDGGNSDYGTSIVGTVGDGVFTTGSKYYVTTAGSYSTSAGSPSVNAGLAISTTALLLNGDT